MSVEIQPEAYLTRSALRQQWPLWCSAAIYVLLLAFNIAYHEPWVDEAQAWLLARDSNLWNLWTKLMRYEGSPGLWHTLLYFCIRCGVPYSAINVVSGSAGLAGVWVLLRYAPFPLPVRLLLPFTFFLSYQYAVIARNYVLAPVLLFLCAVFYKDGIRRSGTITILLCLLAAVNAQAFLLSASIWFVFQLRMAGRWRALDIVSKKKLTLHACAYLFTLSVILLLIWPTRDITFARVPDWSIGNFLSVTVFAFSQAFGDGILPAIALGLTVPFLWKRGGLLLLLLPSFLLCVFGAVVYSIYWHWGFLFLIWLFALWVSADNGKLTRLVTAALCLVIVVQGYWTYASTMYDWKNPYSGSLQAARYLQTQKLIGQRLYAVGLSCLAVQPYFRRNIFANFNSGQNRAYWDWSRGNHMNDTVEHLGSSPADYVLIGYLSPPEKQLWTQLVTASGYRLQKHFEGQTFWRTQVIQPDSYDLYARTKNVRDESLSSNLNMGDPKIAYQLLWGFYTPENAWRWTARKFTVALQRPPEKESSGQLHVSFYIPEEQVKKLGSVELQAHISAYRLATMTVRHGGLYEYVCKIPQEALFGDMLFVEFTLSKAIPPSAKDARELGIVVSSIRIDGGV